MKRRIVSAVAAALGLIVIALAVCSATIWRPSSTTRATLTAAPDQPYLLVEQGVLGLVDSKVTVTATADGKPITLALAHGEDVRAWIADDPYISVSGLRSWTTLESQSVTHRCEQTASASSTASATPSESATQSATAQASATATAAPVDENGCVQLAATGANPAGSDLWLKTATGTGTVTMKTDASDWDLVLLAATDGTAPAPQVTLSWPRAVSTPWLIPGLIVGGLFILAGVFVFLLDIQIRRADHQRRQRAAERAARLAAADLTMTVGIPAVEDPSRPLTRRERRDRERAQAAGEEWIDPRTGVVYINGEAAPAVPQAPGATDAQTAAHTSDDDDAEPTDQTRTVTAVDDCEDDAHACRLAGPARGAAVVPHLDPQTVQALRAERHLASDEPFFVAPDEEPTADADTDDSGHGGDDAVTTDGAVTGEEEND